MNGLLSVVFILVALPARFLRCTVRQYVVKAPSPIKGGGVWDGKECLHAPHLLPLIVLLTVGAAPLALLEDSVLLKGQGPGNEVKEIRAKVTELKPDHITAIVSKEEVTSVNYSMEDKEGYMDKVSFGSAEIACKIMDMGESTMVLGIPREEIASVRVFFQKEQNAGSQPKSDTALRGGSGSPKAEASVAPSSLQELKEELKKELKEEMGAERKQEEKVAIAQSTGRVEGKITRGGNPLPGCKVKIVLMVKRGGAFFGKFTAQSDAPEFETETDREGKYFFQEVPEGDYKLFWRPPWETSWIRRMKMEPDVFVQAGKTCNPKDVDTGRTTVN